MVKAEACEFVKVASLKYLTYLNVPLIKLLAAPHLKIISLTISRTYRAFYGGISSK